jgi:hypothetical protein
MRVHIRVSRSG